MICEFCNKEMIESPELNIHLCKNHGDTMILYDCITPGSSLSLCKNGYEIQKTAFHLRLIKYHDSKTYKQNYKIFYNKLDFEGYYYSTPITIQAIPFIEKIDFSVENFDNLKNKISTLNVFS